MDRIIVTGGAGFIGSNFVRHALANGSSRVVALDKLTYAGHLCSLEDLTSDPRFAFIQADIADRGAVTAVFDQFQPTAVFNLAAETHVDRSIDDPKPFIESNIVGTYQLLEVSRQYLLSSGRQLSDRFRLIHVSTDEVYGTLGETGLFSETTPYAPNSPYSASKAAADHLVRAYHETYRLPALITNCSNNYGPFQFPEKLIPLTLLNAIDAEPLPIYGDGGNVRDWLYVEDHCSGVMLAGKAGKPGEKYNIGGSNELTNLQVVDHLCATLESLMPAESNPSMAARGLKKYENLKTFVKDRPGHDRRYAIDSSKIRNELGWKPGHAFDEGLRRTIEWYLGNREWCEKVQSGRYGRERLGLISEKGA